MISYLEYNQIDKVKWDKCIDNSVNRLVYAYSWYLDIVCERWEALVEDDYISVFPFNIGIKYGFKYLYQPAFTQQLGVFSINNINHDLVQSFLNTISEKYKFIEFNLNYKNNSISNKFVSSHKKTTSPVIDFNNNSNYELRLGSDYEGIQNLYSLNHKRNLKKAMLSDSLIFGEPDIKEVISLFRNNRGKDIKNLNDKHYEILTNLINACRDKGLCKIVGAYRDKHSDSKELSAGIVFIETVDRHILLFSGSDASAKKNGAMYMLIDNHIRQYADKNIIFDFEGSNDKSLARFYNGFGATENKYLSVKLNTLPLHIKIFLKFMKWIKKNTKF